MKSQVDSLATGLESGYDTYQDAIDILTARCFDFHVKSTTKLASGLGGQHSISKVKKEEEKKR
jgi:hypothetical protein